MSSIPVSDPPFHATQYDASMKRIRVLTTCEERTRHDEFHRLGHGVISFEEDTSVVDICEFFQTQNKRRAPIVRDGKLQGIVSRHDIIKLIVSIREKAKSQPTRRRREKR